MRPHSPLPIDTSWQTTEDYVESLLTFVSTSTLFRNLCGGVHILDFLTRKPDLYTWILPEDWRTWFDEVEVEEVLDLLLREDLTQFDRTTARSDGDVEHVKENAKAKHEHKHSSDQQQWRGHTLPPRTLLNYIETIRKHSLDRSYEWPRAREPLPRHVAVGMKPKKIHEVTEFAAFVDELSEFVVSSQSRPANGEDQSGNLGLTVIDFGSGQNYLGRTLACPPYNKHVVAIEQWRHNVQGAKGMDVHAKLAQKEKKIINKKEYKKSLLLKSQSAERNKPSPNANGFHTDQSLAEMWKEAAVLKASHANGIYAKEQDESIVGDEQAENQARNESDDKSTKYENTATHQHSHYDFEPTRGAIEYVEKELANGDLSDIVQTQHSDTMSQHPRPSSSMVVSIHSCGNLSHHALRSLTLNPHVRAVAVIGCCYNLLTERLGPATFKLPSLRSYHPRLEATSSSYDRHGFPMSRRLEEFEFDVPISDTTNRKAATNERTSDYSSGRGKGVRLNITARMMAVQAPHNWGPKDSEEFFTKHFYRALLQRILLDVGVVQMATKASSSDIDIAGGTLSGKDTAGTPLIIGTLRRSCFVSFPAYVQGAIEKLSADPVEGLRICAMTQRLLDDPTIIERYEQEYAYAKKHLSVIWSLMAFSANVVESTILVDRWLWLTEQSDVKDAWVQSVFDYRQSPRNMVVVGSKGG